MAVASGHENISLWILHNATNKADVRDEDNSGQTPPSYAAQNRKETIVKLLLDTARVDPKARDNMGWTPWSLVVGNRHKAAANLLPADMAAWYMQFCTH